MPKFKKSQKKANSNNRPIRKPKLWAIIIGVNNYKKPIENLNYCANDAVGLGSALEKVALQKTEEKEAIFDSVDIRIYCDRSSSDSFQIKEPKKNNIITSLDILKKAEAQDTILFYFSGHGFYDKENKETILCLPETEKDNLSKTGLLIKNVLKKISKSSAKQQLIWLDACHSGGVASHLIDAILEVNRNNPKIYAIAACKGNEESSELKELEHGIFTYHLIKGLEGGLSNSEIKLGELYRYVYHQTIKYIEEFNELTKFTNTDEIIKPFHPQRIAFGDGEFILGYNSLSSKDNKSRGALVFDGIKPSKITNKLDRVLASKGGFTHQPYPNKEESLHDSISALLRSPNLETALLYLKGKFITIDRGTIFFVLDDGTRISREWLAQELANSPVQHQIIILDCQNKNIKGQIDLLKQSDKSQCIVAVGNNWLSSKFPHLITNNSVEGLTGTRLLHLISRSIPQEQREVHRSSTGKIINVILPQPQQLDKVVADRNYCPYKGLEAFTLQDKDFFFGREDITQEIIAQLETASFIPVVGASGSGKSSIIQAGVIPKILKEGIFDPEKNLLKSCQVWILRPGENPLQALASGLNSPLSLLQDSSISTLQKGDFVESFVAWLRQQPQRMGILVIDQFEELFTQASDANRNKFLELILGTLKYASDRLKIIITLRSDFMASCLSIAELGEIVRQNPIYVPSYLTKTQYRQIITEPATRVGLAVQPALVDVLVEQILTEKGALPLLEFTLEQLWENRQKNELSLRVYNKKIGGIKQVLKKRADEIYKKLSKEQKKCAEWIFTQLVSLGEGQEDTRRRRNLSELIVPKYPPKLIESTLNILGDSRLIVMSNQDGDKIIDRQAKVKTKGENQEEKPESLELSSDSEVTVEIAHEILIRNWQQLRWWLDENREQIRLRERLEAKAKEWKDNEEKPDYLIGGVALAQAEEFYIKSADELSEKTQEFIAEGIKNQEGKKILRQKSQIKSQIFRISRISLLTSIFTIFTIYIIYYEYEPLFLLSTRVFIISFYILGIVLGINLGAKTLSLLINKIRRKDLYPSYLLMQIQIILTLFSIIFMNILNTNFLNSLFSYWIVDFNQLDLNQFLNLAMFTYIIISLVYPIYFFFNESRLGEFALNLYYLMLAIVLFGKIYSFIFIVDLLGAISEFLNINILNINNSIILGLVITIIIDSFFTSIYLSIIITFFNDVYATITNLFKKVFIMAAYGFLINNLSFSDTSRGKFCIVFIVWILIMILIGNYDNKKVKLFLKNKALLFFIQLTILVSLLIITKYYILLKNLLLKILETKIPSMINYNPNSVTVIFAVIVFNISFLSLVKILFKNQKNLSNIVLNSKIIKYLRRNTHASIISCVWFTGQEVKIINYLITEYSIPVRYIYSCLQLFMVIISLYIGIEKLQEILELNSKRKLIQNSTIVLFSLAITIAISITELSTLVLF